MPPVIEEKIKRKTDFTISRNFLSIEKKTKLCGILKKMFQSETNRIRPRKINGTWSNQHQKQYNSVFKIGELHGAEPHDFTVSLPVESYGEQSRSINKKKMENSKWTVRMVVQQIENYFDKTTLHGLRYVGDNSLSIAERVFWFLAFASAFAFATYYITNVFEKWKNNPVLVAYNPTDATLNEIPFPAITICNMNQAKRVEAERIAREGNSIEKELLSDYCNDKNSSYDSPGQAPGWSIVQNFLIRVGQSCADTVKFCSWQNVRISCEEFFNNDLTDEGLCCSFNRLPPENVFRNATDFASLNHTYPAKVYDWSPEHGFAGPNDGDINVIPIRPSGAGSHLGLTVVVDAQVHNYFCSSTSSIGFKIMLSNPIETPKIADFGFLVSPGVEARYNIKPEIREATKKVRDVSIGKRQCYFQDERPLRYFRTYTNRNCNLECQSNHTLTKCKCIPYYLPKSKTVTVCGKRDEQCINQAKQDMELVFGNGSSCKCLPSCFELNFGKTSTYSNLIKLEQLHNIDNITDEYFQKNMAVLHFFFSETRFRRVVKSEIYGFTEVLSNIGGLLGLCLGFSVLSLVELIYYISLKLFCGYIKSRKQGQKKKENGVIPFIK